MNTVRTAQSDSDFAAAQVQGLRRVAGAASTSTRRSPPRSRTFRPRSARWSRAAAATCRRPSSTRCSSWPPNPSVGFRTDSTRMIVWFGDAAATTRATVTRWPRRSMRSSRRTSKVIAVPVVTGGGDGLDSTGQATAIATATGGVGAAERDTRPGVSRDPLRADEPAGDGVAHADMRSRICHHDARADDAGDGDERKRTSTYDETITVRSGEPRRNDAALHRRLPAQRALRRPGLHQSISVAVNGADLGGRQDGPCARDQGHDFTYHLAASNSGPAAATGVAVTDTLPANSTFVSASAGCPRRQAS